MTSPALPAEIRPSLTEMRCKTPSVPPIRALRAKSRNLRSRRPVRPVSSHGARAWTVTSSCGAVVARCTGCGKSFAPRVARSRRIARAAFSGAHRPAAAQRQTLAGGVGPSSEPSAVTRISSSASGSRRRNRRRATPPSPTYGRNRAPSSRSLSVLAARAHRALRSVGLGLRAPQRLASTWIQRRDVRLRLALFVDRDDPVYRISAWPLLPFIVPVTIVASVVYAIKVWHATMCACRSSPTSSTRSSTRRLKRRPPRPVAREKRARRGLVIEDRRGYARAPKSGNDSCGCGRSPRSKIVASAAPRVRESSAARSPQRDRSDAPASPDCRCADTPRDRRRRPPPIASCGG